MKLMAEHALIFGTDANDDWVEKRSAAASDIQAWLTQQSPAVAARIAAKLGSSFGQVALADDVAAHSEVLIQKHAPSFVRSAARGDVQIQVIMGVAVAEWFAQDPVDAGWSAVTAMAAVLWSTLAFQAPLNEVKLEQLRTLLLETSRTYSRKVATIARRRQSVPQIGHVNIDQDSQQGARVNTAFKRAVEPVVLALQENAALDREELDFLWWLLSEHSELLDVPLTKLDPLARAIVSGLEVANKLHQIPADAHRRIALRQAPDSIDSYSLQDAVDQLGAYRVPLAAAMPVPQGLEAAMPLLHAISDPASIRSSSKLSAYDWGARALLEGAIFRFDGRQRAP